MPPARFYFCPGWGVAFRGLALGVNEVGSNGSTSGRPRPWGPESAGNSTRSSLGAARPWPGPPTPEIKPPTADQKLSGAFRVPRGPVWRKGGGVGPGLGSGAGRGSAAAGGRGRGRGAAGPTRTNVKECKLLQGRKQNLKTNTLG